MEAVMEYFRKLGFKGKILAKLRWKKSDCLNICFYADSLSLSKYCFLNVKQGTQTAFQTYHV